MIALIGFLREFAMLSRVLGGTSKPSDWWHRLGWVDGFGGSPGLGCYGG